MTLRFGTRVRAVQRNGDGSLEVSSEDGASLTVDKRWCGQPGAINTDRLNLSAAGVHVEANGVVPTDAFQNTNVPGIHAIGDIIGRAELTPVAIAAGRRLAARLFRGQADSRLDYENIPGDVQPPADRHRRSHRRGRARARFGDIKVPTPPDSPRCTTR